MKTEAPAYLEHEKTVGQANFQVPQTDPPEAEILYISTSTAHPPRRRDLLYLVGVVCAVHDNSGVSLVGSQDAVERS